jgi:hypothetical protein
MFIYLKKKIYSTFFLDKNAVIDINQFWKCFIFN